MCGARELKELRVLFITCSNPDNITAIYDQESKRVKLAMLSVCGMVLFSPANQSNTNQL